MYVEMDWNIEIGNYYLAMMAGCEIYKSVDVLASTCIITLPGFAYSKAFEIEDKIKRGDEVKVNLGYNKVFKVEFEGYLQNISTDAGTLTLNCEDDLFLFRYKAVKDKEFVNATAKSIVQYLLDQTGLKMEIDSTIGIDYNKFVISRATAYDVLKKLKEETSANIFITKEDDKVIIHIHPPYTQDFETVHYSFQQNIEKDSLKYIRKEDRNIEIVVSSTGKDGNKKEVRYGTTGGEAINKTVYGMSDEGMKAFAKQEFDQNYFDGYEGNITTWLVPFVKPGDSAYINDEDYEYKNGRYYVTSVKTSFDANGAVRDVQLGKRLS